MTSLLRTSLLFLGMAPLLLSAKQHTIPEGFEEIDRINSIIYFKPMAPDQTVTQENSEAIILDSELRRPAIDGNPQTKDDLQVSAIAKLEIVQRHAYPSEEEIDKDMANIERIHNIDQAQIEATFAASGYTYKEGRTKIADAKAERERLGFKMSSITVTKGEVAQYYETHPEVLKARYQVQIITVPYDADTPMAEQKQILIDAVNEKATEGLLANNASLCSPFWIEHGTLDEQKEFIYYLDLGKIHPEPAAGTDGFEFYKLVDKVPERTRTLDERYNEITMQLRQAKVQEVLEQDRKELLDKAIVAEVA